MLSRNFSVLSAARASFFVSKQLRVSLNPCLRWQRSDQPRESLRTFNYNLLIRARSESRKEFFFLPTSNEFFGVSLRHSGKHPQTHRAIPGIKTMLETKIDRVPWNEVGGVQMPRQTSWKRDEIKFNWMAVNILFAAVEMAASGMLFMATQTLRTLPGLSFVKNGESCRRKACLHNGLQKSNWEMCKKKFLFAKIETDPIPCHWIFIPRRCWRKIRSIRNIIKALFSLRMNLNFSVTRASMSTWLCSASLHFCVHESLKADSD